VKLAAALVLVATATAAAAPAPPPAGTKKAAYLDEKHAPPPRAKKPMVGKPAPPVINLRNTWTDEWLVLDADPRQAVPAPALRDHFLRDHYTNEPTTMDAKLLGTLRDAARHFNARRIDIVSGFRAPKYNLMLRKKGHQVARDSQHTHGNAVDFRIPGVDLESLHTWAVSRHLGGVGRYRSSGFVHMDTGKVRYWDGD
jgi:uncharacterized protein YcbK (DUF882 family)